MLAGEFYRGALTGGVHAPHVEPGATAADARTVSVSPKRFVQQIPSGLDESLVDAWVAADLDVG